MHTLIFLSIFVFVVQVCPAQETLVACGDNQVLIIKHDPFDQEDQEITWRWSVENAYELDPDFRKKMIPTDDCKPVANDTQLLITSSGGGVILLNIEDKKIEFHAQVPNAHSAELLPNGRIVVALSIANGGNALELFDPRHSNEPIYRDSLYSGHGVVWMPKHQRIFALGFDELRAYSLGAWSSDKPFLKKEHSWILPGESGHDLVAVSENLLLLTTHEGAWSFQIPDEEFTPFAPLDTVPDIKSIFYRPEDGRIIYTKGETRWWTHRIHCLEPNKILEFPEVKLYKTRVMEGAH
ncbi:MAG: hypothetical protein HKN87_06855 [Saprospiraceae bacterium]|nr:hypothetical protein [Saprospiraceae bacterium]